MYDSSSRWEGELCHGVFEVTCLKGEKTSVHQQVIALQCLGGDASCLRHSGGVLRQLEKRAKVACPARQEIEEEIGHE